MVFVPIFAEAGLNVPVVGFVIPFPDQVPPGVVAVSVIGESSEHIAAPLDVIVASGVANTLIVIFSVLLHPACVT